MLADLEEDDREALGITSIQLKTMRNLGIKSDKKSLATTRVIIDGRGCLVGKGRNFDAKVFKKRLDAMLLEAGADAKQVRNCFCFLMLLVIFIYLRNFASFFDGRPNLSAWRTLSRRMTRTIQSTTSSTQALV